jgi:hypothetical protein
VDACKDIECKECGKNQIKQFKEGSCCAKCVDKAMDCESKDGQMVKDGQELASENDKCLTFVCESGALLEQEQGCPDPLPGQCGEDETLIKTPSGGCCPTYDCKKKDADECAGGKKCSACKPGYAPDVPTDGECCGKCKPTPCETDSGVPIKHGGIYKDPETPCVSVMCTAGATSEIVQDCAPPPQCGDSEILKEMKIKGKCCSEYTCEPEPKTCSSVQCPECSGEWVATDEDQCCGTCISTSPDCVIDGSQILAHRESKVIDCKMTKCFDGELYADEKSCPVPEVECKEDEEVVEKANAEDNCCPAYECAKKPDTCDVCEPCAEGYTPSDEAMGSDGCCPTCLPESCVTPEGAVLEHGDTITLPCSESKCWFGQIIVKDEECGDMPDASTFCSKDEKVITITSDKNCCPRYDCQPKEDKCKSQTCPTCKNGEKAMTSKDDSDCCYKCEKTSCDLPSGNMLLDGGEKIDPEDSCITWSCDNKVLMKDTQRCPGPRTCGEDEISKSTKAAEGCCDIYTCEVKPDKCKTEVCGECGDGFRLGPVSGNACCGECMPDGCSYDGGVLDSGDRASKEGKTISCLEGVLTFSQTYSFDIVFEGSKSEVEFRVREQLESSGNYDMSIVKSISAALDTGGRRAGDLYKVTFEIEGDNEAKVDLFKAKFDLDLVKGTFNKWFLCAKCTTTTTTTPAPQKSSGGDSSGSGSTTIVVVIAVVVVVVVIVATILYTRTAKQMRLPPTQAGPATQASFTNPLYDEANRGVRPQEESYDSGVVTDSGSGMYDDVQAPAEAAGEDEYTYQDNFEGLSPGGDDALYDDSNINNASDGSYLEVSNGPIRPEVDDAEAEYDDL